MHEDKESANRKPLSIKDNLFAFRCKMCYKFLFLILTSGLFFPSCIMLLDGMVLLILNFWSFFDSICLNASAGRVAPGFGIGALEELDAEDEDVYASG